MTQASTKSELKVEPTSDPKVVVLAKKQPEIRDVQVNDAGFAFRNVMVRLPEGMTADDLRDPKIWRRIQIGDMSHRLLKYDHLFILSFDETWFCNAIVSYADQASAALAILKVGTFHEVDKALYADGTYKVTWTGAGFGVQRVSDNVMTSNQTHSTEALAITALRNLYPKKIG